LQLSVAVQAAIKVYHNPLPEKHKVDLHLFSSVFSSGQLTALCG